MTTQTETVRSLTEEEKAEMVRAIQRKLIDAEIAETLDNAIAQTERLVGELKAHRERLFDDNGSAPPDRLGWAVNEIMNYARNAVRFDMLASIGKRWAEAHTQD